MQQKDNHHNLRSQASGSDQEKAVKIEDWRNEHGQPNFEFLQSLMNDDSIDALEKLKSIAEDIGTRFGPNASRKELVDSMRFTVAENGDSGSHPTT